MIGLALKIALGVLAGLAALYALPALVKSLRLRRRGDYVSRWTLLHLDERYGQRSRLREKRVGQARGSEE